MEGHDFPHTGKIQKTEDGDFNFITDTLKIIIIKPLDTVNVCVAYLSIGAHIFIGVTCSKFIAFTFAYILLGKLSSHPLSL